MFQSPQPPPDVPPPSKWDPLVISVIGVICATFLLLSYYRILKRHCFSLGEAPTQRYRTERRLFDEADLEDPSLQFQSRGLDSAIICGLPTIQFKKKSGGEVEFEETECAVCLGEFEQGDWLRFLPSCTHSFHIACIDTWFQTHSNCPLCRSNIIYNNLTNHQDYSVSRLTSPDTSQREETMVGETGDEPHMVHLNSNARTIQHIPFALDTT